MTSPLPVPQYLVAFGNNAYDDPASITTIAGLTGIPAPANLLTAADATFSGPGSWAPGASYVGGSTTPGNCTVAVSGGELVVTAVGGPGNAMTVSTGLYSASAFASGSAVVVFGPAAHVQDVGCEVYWYNASGAYVTRTTGTLILESGTGNVTSWIDLSRPAGATQMALIAYWQNQAAAGETHEIVNAAIYPPVPGYGFWNQYGGSVGGPGAPGVWTDITAYVLGHRLTRGRQYELVQFQAATLDLDMRDNDGAFSRWNTSSPLYGLLSVRRPVRLRVQSPTTGTWYDRFTGVLTDIAPSWPDAASQWVKLSASDAFRLFATSKLNVNQYQATVVADGASCLYRLGDPSTTAVDSKGANPSGTIYGQPTLGVPGPFVTDATGGVKLAGAHSDQVALPAAFAAMQGGSTAVEWWASGSGRILTQPSSGGGGNLYLSVDPTGVVSLADDGFGALATSTSGAFPQDGAWHHVVVQSVLSGSTLTTTVWVDRIIACQQTYLYGTSPGTALPGLATSVQLGPAPGGTDTSSAANFAYYPAGLTSAQIANHYNAGTKAQLQRASGARVSEVLDAVGWSSGARQIDTGVSQVQPTTSTLTGTTALSHLQAVEQTEAGALFMDSAGQVVFLSRQTLFTGAAYQQSQATFGDNAGEIVFQPGSAPANDDQLLYNTAEVTRAGGAVQIALSAPSRDQYGPQTYTLSGLLSVSDAEALARAQYAVTQYATPADRLPSLTVQLTDLTGAGYVNDTILGLELMERVTANRHAVGFSESGLIEQISETAGPDSWTVTFGLSPADTGHYWIAGDATYGLAGVTTVAAF